MVISKILKDLGIPIIYFGYLWAAINLVVAIFGRYAHKIEKSLGSSTLLVILGVLPIIGYLGMSFSYIIAGILFGLCFQIARAFNSVIIADGINKRVSADMRATANSISSLGIRVLFIMFGPLVGYIIDQQGVHQVYLYLGLFYIFCFIVLIIPLLKQRIFFDPIEKQSHPVV